MTRKSSNGSPPSGNSNNGAPEPISGITRYNFLDRGKAFMQAQGGRGFVVVRDQHGRSSVPFDADGPENGYPVTVRQWGAWRAWRRYKNIATRFMERQGYYTVPAEWPHQFDADWPEHKSVDAANRFQDRQEAQ